MGKRDVLLSLYPSPVSGIFPVNFFLVRLFKIRDSLFDVGHVSI